MTRRSLLTALLLTLATGLAMAAPVSRPAALDSYLGTLAAVEAAKKPVSLEPLFAATDAVQDTLMFLQADGNSAWIETLSDIEYTALQKELRGFHLSRGYDIYAQPDGAFLYALAQAHGRAEDVAFFRLYSELWSKELMPRYLSMGNNPTPCVRFGEDILPDLYAGWGDFATRHPQAYTAFTQQTLRDLEEVVVLGVCSCGDEQSVERELSGFLKRFPQMPGASDVGKRLKELKEDPTLRPVRCR